MAKGSYDVEFIAVISCDGPDCLIKVSQKLLDIEDPPQVPAGWYVIQQDGTNWYHSLACVRNMLAQMTVYRGLKDWENETIEPERFDTFWYSLRDNRNGCKKHGPGCEYNHGT